MAPGSGEAAALLRFHEVMRGLHAREDLQTLLGDIARSVTEVTGFEQAVINIVRDDGRLEAVVVEGPESLRETLLGQVIDRAEFDGDFATADQWGLLRFLPHERARYLEWDSPIHVPDFEMRTDVDDAWHPYDVLYAPLEDAHGELLGVLNVDVPSDLRTPNDFQRQLLEMFAVQAGLAISHARQRRVMSERVRLGGMHRRVMRRAGHLDVAGLVSHGVEAISTGMRAHGATVALFGDGDRPLTVTSFPISPGGGPTDALLASAGKIARAAWARREPVKLEEEGVAPGRVRREITRRGLSTVLLAPIGNGEECLGFFMAARKDEPPWSSTEAEAAMDLGRDLGRAVLNARLYEREQRLVGSLRELDDYKRRLMTTISHEMKSPLTSIQGHLELLEAWLGDPSLSAIERSAKRLGGLAEDFLLLLRLDGPTPPDLTNTVDLRAVVDDAVDLVSGAAHHSGITVERVTPQGAVLTRGDAKELERVAANLVGNAVKFSEEGGRVRVECGRTTSSGGPDEVWLRVSDTGLGISDDDQRRLFQEFFRSSNPVALAVGGTGLGLSIVDRIVTRHEGRIELVSALGEGTTFTVTLPAADQVS